jgi:hypothetical protein
MKIWVYSPLVGQPVNRQPFLKEESQYQIYKHYRSYGQNSPWITSNYGTDSDLCNGVSKRRR